MRAYSMANYPDEKDVVKLNVRIATPPPRADEAPPGVMSSYIFNLKPGDQVRSPARTASSSRKIPTTRWSLSAVAPAWRRCARTFSISSNANSKRKMTFWYGARSLREMFYVDEFDELAAEHDNFNWHLALSEPQPEDNWDGLTGFIHQVLLDEYLSKHPAPEDCEYYLCGPPMMNTAVVKMLDSLGVQKENILLDDFGG